MRIRSAFCATVPAMRYRVVGGAAAVAVAVAYQNKVSNNAASRSLALERFAGSRGSQFSAVQAARQIQAYLRRVRVGRPWSSQQGLLLEGLQDVRMTDILCSGPDHKIDLRKRMHRLCSLLAIIVVWAESPYYRERASPAMRIISNKAPFLQ